MKNKNYIFRAKNIKTGETEYLSYMHDATHMIFSELEPVGYVYDDYFDLIRYEVDGDRMVGFYDSGDDGPLSVEQYDIIRHKMYPLTYDYVAEVGRDFGPVAAYHAEGCVHEQEMAEEYEATGLGWYRP